MAELKNVLSDVKKNLLSPLSARVKGDAAQPTAKLSLAAAERQIMIAKLKPLFTTKNGPLAKLVPNKRLKWDDLRPALEAADLADLESAVGSVGHAYLFIRKMTLTSSACAVRLAIARAKPGLICPVPATVPSTTRVPLVLDAIKLTWEEVEPALQQLESPAELERAFTEPEQFLQDLFLKGSGPAAKRLLIARSKPLLVPALLKVQKPAWTRTTSKLSLAILSAEDSNWLKFKKDVNDKSETVRRAACSTRNVSGACCRLPPNLSWLLSPLLADSNGLVERRGRVAGAGR